MKHLVKSGDADRMAESKLRE